tara:strand:- start:318 stop:1064 length:747 start_codon:yes stop_codon:yes gene_type:complete
MKLSGKTAFITGCNRGVGKAVCENFLNNGANIICAVRKKNSEFSKYIRFLKKKFKTTIQVLEFDLSDEKKMLKSLKLIYNKNLIIDILVNNAAIATGSLFEMTSMPDLKRVFEINYFAQMNIIQKLLRHMKKSKNASIINVGSIAGFLNHRGTIAYGSSKAALMFSTKVMANEFSLYKIRVNAIAPSAVNTDMFNQMTQKGKIELLKKSYLKKPLTKKKIVDKILYLASDQSLKVNGQVIKIYGRTSN